MKLLFILFFLNIGILSASLPDKVVFCGVCKDVEYALPNMIASIESVGSSFQDYRVFVYENNSSDNTAYKLKKWASRNRKVTVISENLSTEELQSIAKSHTWNNLPFRTEVIARARNIVLGRALAPEFESYKYVIAMDMDFLSPWNTREILASFTKNTEWDAICSNGITNQNHVYDRYALRDSNMPFGPELLGEEWWRHISTPITMDKSQGLISVYSAFGGLAIYKRESIKGCLYSGVVTKELETVVKKVLSNTHHPEVIKYNSRDDFKHEVFFTTNEQDSVKWICNSGGYEVPPCCEHVTFHAMMIYNNHSNIFINPRMTILYE